MTDAHALPSPAPPCLGTAKLSLSPYTLGVGGEKIAKFLQRERHSLAAAPA